MPFFGDGRLSVDVADIFPFGDGPGHGGVEWEPTVSAVLGPVISVSQEFLFGHRYDRHGQVGVALGGVFIVGMVCVRVKVSPVPDL